MADQSFSASFTELLATARGTSAFAHEQNLSYPISSYTPYATWGIMPLVYTVQHGYNASGIYSATWGIMPLVYTVQHGV